MRFLCVLVLAMPAIAADWSVSVLTGHGIEQSQGITTSTVSVCRTFVCGKVERFGGVANTTTAYAFGGVYTPGWKPFGVQPMFWGGVSYFEDEIIMPDRPDRPLINDPWSFQLGVGFRWRYFEGWFDVHDSTDGRSRINTGIDRWEFGIRIPLQ